MKNKEVDYINMRRLATRSLYNNLMPGVPIPENLRKENDLKFNSYCMKKLGYCSKMKVQCEFARSKYYNYGFMKGNACFCDKQGAFTSDMKDCAIISEETYEIRQEMIQASR